MSTLWFLLFFKFLSFGLLQVLTRGLSQLTFVCQRIHQSGHDSLHCCMPVSQHAQRFWIVRNVWCTLARSTSAQRHANPSKCNQEVQVCYSAGSRRKVDFSLQPATWQCLNLPCVGISGNNVWLRMTGWDLGCFSWWHSSCVSNWEHWISDRLDWMQASNNLFICYCCVAQNRQAALQSLPSRVTAELQQYRDSDDESDDWDRYPFNEDEGYSSGQGSGRRQEIEAIKRAEETSIFGLTNKRRQEPLRYVTTHGLMTAARVYAIRDFQYALRIFSVCKRGWLYATHLSIQHGMPLSLCLLALQLMHRSVCRLYISITWIPTSKGF